MLFLLFERNKKIYNYSSNTVIFFNPICHRKYLGKYLPHKSKKVDDEVHLYMYCTQTNGKYKFKYTICCTYIIIIIIAIITTTR